MLLLDSPDTRPRPNASASVIVSQSVTVLLALTNDTYKTTPERGECLRPKPQEVLRILRGTHGQSEGISVTKDDRHYG
jgi:hypothetical protein